MNTSRHEMPRHSRSHGTLLLPALLLSQVGQGLTFVILVGVLPQISAHFGGGTTGELIAQQMIALPFLGIALGGLLSVWAIRRFGLRQTILGGSALFTVAGSVPMWTDGAWPILSGCLLLGVGAALVVSAMSGMVGEFFEGLAASRIISLQVAVAIFTAAAVGLGVAYAAETWGWRAPFAGYVLVGGVTFVVSMIALPDIRPETGPNEGLWSLLSRGALGFALGFLAFVVFTAHPSLTPFLMEQHGIERPVERQFYMTLATIATFVGSLVYAFAQGRVPRRGLTASAFVALACGLATFATWTGSPSAMAAGQLVFGLGLDWQSRGFTRKP